jgi:GntR family transcriptional repressor for pyruvate dehydrogenase complex
MPRVKEKKPNSHRTMYVVNHIHSLIENGTLQPGDKIPPEREFARSLKISRASLRTGIGYLAAMGVMKVRHGVGTFVADGPPEFAKGSLRLIGALVRAGVPAEMHIFQQGPHGTALGQSYPELAD